MWAGSWADFQCAVCWNIAPRAGTRLARFGYVKTDVGRAQEFRYLEGEIEGANVIATKPERETSWLCGRHEPGGLHVFWPPYPGLV